ncbi:MAG TPA: hypothetical protein VE974_11530 [Thermoanaerobaculia bacterium]|nr:hypothetical protein [Thermoanaerobaculia bacterium]
MKRLLFALLLLVLPSAAFAFDATRATRIGVLRGTDALQMDVAAALRNELRARGFEAFDAVRTYDEAVRDGAAVADYYVEIAGGDAGSSEYGGIGIGTRHVGVSLGVLVSRVAAEVRIYDGETMELVETHELTKRNTAVVPTSVGIGGASLFAYIALPYIERAQVRRVVRAAGRTAADIVADAVR